MMKKVLIVEDSPSMPHFEKRRIEEELSLETETVKTCSDTRRILEKKAGDYLVALVDLVLPDAPNGEAIDYVIARGVPVIAFTRNLNDEIRELLMEKNILGYAHKASDSNFHFVLRLIRYIQQNDNKEALIVDDSKVSRTYLNHLLRNQHFMTHQASNAAEALQILKDHPNIRLMLTDYRMPECDGSQLVAEVRKKFSFEDLVIIGISAYGNPVTSVEFLKNGANDFITKPFLAEEFLYRIMQNMQRLDFIHRTQKHANYDSLTGLYNRRYLFEAGRQYYENAKRDTLDFSLAMIDVDDFKPINDTYGHQTGDLVLKILADIVTANMRKTDLLARYGGEEFCFLIAGVNKAKAAQIMENIREMIAKTTITSIDGRNFNVTVSIGITDEPGETFAQMIGLADQRLYDAKREGKNRVAVI